jgi:glutamate formiminotransferase/formiminotetrahydrofolate cyclodeaminase
MRAHHGEHARMGALDVCPFVPVSGVTMDDCVALAREFGRRAAEELGIPVYLYEAAASQEHRRTLSQIRAGEYEGLAEKIARPDWRPDFGPARFVPAWGATVTGARHFLIAYNVNLLATKEQAHRIALELREQGRGPQQPGRLRAVKAVGWWVEEYGMAQVSMNLDDFKVTPPHVAFEEVVKEARALKLAVAGSEIVGLIPLQALLMAAEHYIEAEGLFIVDEKQKIRLAADRLGLGAVSPFVPSRRVIEYMVAGEADAPLASSSVRDFVRAVGARTSAPGGGSASALMAALGAALGTMVGWMTYGKRKFEDKDAVMRRLLPPCIRRWRPCSRSSTPTRGPLPTTWRQGTCRTKRRRRRRSGTRRWSRGSRRRSRCPFASCAWATAAGRRWSRWRDTAISRRAPTSRWGPKLSKPGCGVRTGTSSSTFPRSPTRRFAPLPVARRKPSHKGPGRASRKS